ncbi:histidine kinase [Actinoplanes sp. SE50]|uniref:hybrid sensor histidine kinase/response regulator n=1 Tax=unclassified Actinoplanes TaxID=2626549 RepID=UPI00023EC75A|nr:MULTISPECIES: PAS domain-containing sensor histidine kinase [unclassified Actinoplanes]AEV83089.1 multi-sensor hybrid histidine kinase [Actinoplanes sp. SE50/110]ATO81485.1 histidine kinase [Actinoplanes sp. SE50]SLL98892.1 hybrid sensor histidine kinase/response regulator [Actinoplanes sp. SE50/110]
MNFRQSAVVVHGIHAAYIPVAYAAVTLSAVAAAVAPPRMLMFGMLAVGPAFVAATARPVAVLGVGGYALAAAFTVSTWQGLLGTADQVLRLMLIVVMTVVSWSVARHLGLLLRAATVAAQERQMLAAVVEQSADGIIVTSLDGVVTHWNGGAEQLYRQSADQVVGTGFGRFLPADRQAAFGRALASLAAGERVHLDEARRIRADGAEMLVSVAVSPIRDETGEVVATASTERDITEVKRREAEERLARERSARAARLESLGQLASGVAHDFNNLLAIILNYADFLTEEVTEDGSRDLARIRDAADRARALTGQLLLFAKQESATVEIVDLNEVVSASSELLTRTIGANISLLCRPHPQALPVSANRGRLDQILLNLVINARDAMPDGGVVLIETGRAPGRRVRMTVSDTGCGMSPEVKDRLFEPFFTTKPADRGTGLGLATVYGIVGDAGGSIQVDSTPGVGTTFEILLPLAGDTTGQEPEPDAHRPVTGHGERILLVEDDEFVRDLVVRILNGNGYQTVPLDENAAGDADVAGAAVLLSDIMLRFRSGPAIADQLRTRHPDLRVVFMSGYSDEELRHRYDLSAATGILQKPFTAVELLAAVGTALTPAVSRRG